MALTYNITNTLFLLTVLVVLFPVETYAFGAGDIPDFAYLNDKAFRHGDIESILEHLTKSAGSAAIGGGSLLGIASSVIKHVAGGSKFSKNDIKKVYFGNWLRDYSQAMDIAGLTKLSADTLVLVVSVLGFMTFGYSTQEFEVTADRLGVYLPVEHIDNPKGYAEKEGDARKFHPKLRPPVSREELEIDERTGMKKYMATDGQNWDTSTSFIRRTFKACIEAGRRAQGKEGADLWEAYRLLGTGLHTLEDLLAHSNWCEIALRKMGYNDVFCHVGDRVLINTPNGRAPPLVTGTFGSADFLHSLLGEAGDKLSQASVTDLSQKMDNAAQSQGQKPDIALIKALFNKFGGGSDENKINQGENLQAQSQGYHFNPDNVAPPEVQKQLLDVLRWHDDVMRDISKKIERVPGLSNLLEEFSNALNEYIYTILAPYLGPILQQTTAVIDEGSKLVIDNDDQYEVFNNPDAHDPSHSLLSKDHFGLILNEPAGKIAQIIVENTVNLIVRAWSDNNNPDNVINEILEAFHHPYYNTGRSSIQNKMFDHMQKWIGGLGSEANEIIASLTKESVRDHKNKRKGLEDTVEPGYHGHSHGGPRPTQSGGYSGSGKTNQSYGGNSSYQQPGRADNTTSYGQTGGYGGSNQDNKYGGRSDNQHYGSQQSGGYGTQSSGGYGSQQPSSGYGSQSSGGYGGQSGGGYGSQTRPNQDFSSGRRDDNKGSYGGSGRNDNNYSSGNYGSSTTSHSSGYAPSYNAPSSGYNSQQASNQYSGRDDDDRRGGNKRRDDDDCGKPSYGQGGYGNQQNQSQSGGYGRRDDDDHKYGQSGYGGGGYNKRDDDDDRKKKYGRDNDSDDDKKKKYGQSSGYGGGGYNKRDDDDDNRKKYGRDNDSDEDRKKKYGQQSSGYGGGGYGRKDDDDDRKKKYGRDDDSDDDRKKKYAQSSGYGGGGYGKRDDDDDRKKKYGRDDSDDDKKKKYGQQSSGYGGGGYGGRKDDSDDDKRYKKRSSRSRDRDDDRKGYGGQSQTYGVERMNLGGRGRDDDDDDRRRKQYGGY